MVRIPPRDEPLLAHLTAAGAMKPDEVAAALKDKGVETFEMLLGFSDTGMSVLLKDCGIKAASANSIKGYCAPFR